MENTELKHKLPPIIYNIQADVIIGKNLKKHLTDIYITLARLQCEIAIAIFKDEPIVEREQAKKALLNLGKEILSQLKNPS